MDEETKAPSASTAAVEADETAQNATNSDANVKLAPNRLLLVFVAFMLGFSLTALDQTILSTALPKIASYFDAISDLSWIPSAYFLPQAGLMLFFGRILGITPAKTVLLSVIGVFEIGSLLCAVAPSVNVLILGRVVAGIGASGLMVSVMFIIAQVTTLRQRPIFMGVFGAVYAVASIVGPLIGGAFADHVSWRWCFYINLPIGGVAFVTIFAFLPSIHPSGLKGSTVKAWLSLDWIGGVLSVGMVTLFLIPIQWGGNVKLWDDPEVISLLVLSGVFFLAFILWELRKDDLGILPLHMFRRRNLLGACVEGFFINICFILASYYLPFIYQLRGHSATRSGIDIIPFMISGTLAALFSGPLVAAVGSGLLYTLNGSSATDRIIGYQLIFGAGLGVALQNTMVVVQAEFAKEEALLARATSVVTFTQTLGAAVGLAVGGAIFSGQLKHRLHSIPGLDENMVTAALASVEAVFGFPADLRAQVLSGYIRSVDTVFLFSIAAAVFGVGRLCHN
ncbi:ABC transporter [Mycena sanguinolenta]|uniref:ABC transporter n=1 Tax=Mycena sanguinolenta TaxID=230812 RepID=A0A8H7DIM9_9AGAR|nr:ABC transporter [Mycena sanguinolenta]